MSSRPRFIRRPLLAGPREKTICAELMRKVESAEKAAQLIWATDAHFDILTENTMSIFRHTISDMHPEIYRVADKLDRAVHEKKAVSRLVEQAPKVGTCVPEYDCPLYEFLAAPREAMGFECASIRRQEVCIGHPSQIIVLFPHPAQLAEAADRLSRKIGVFMCKPALMDAIYIFASLLNLHPFLDGNGRLARSVFNWCLVHLGMKKDRFLPLSSIIQRSYGGFDVRLRIAEIAGHWDPLIEFIVNSIALFSDKKAYIA